MVLKRSRQASPHRAKATNNGIRLEGGDWVNLSKSVYQISTKGWLYLGDYVIIQCHDQFQHRSFWSCSTLPTIILQTFID